VAAAAQLSGPAAILDVDGTLVDSNYQHTIAWYQALRQHGQTLAIWRIHRHIGMGGDQLVAALCGDEVGRARRRHPRSREGAVPRDDRRGRANRAHPPARDLIVDLKRLGRPVVLASSAKPGEVEHYLDLVDARGLADAWTSSRDVEATKPEPDLVEAALERVGGGAAVMVGDSTWDCKAAARAGVQTLAVLTGAFSDQELREAGAVEVFHSIEALRRRLSDTALG
jgi:phosphoglycolate phosphatase-like HAD superfamily hydrolase